MHAEAVQRPELHVLLVEDSAHDAELLEIALVAAGYDARLTRVDAAGEMREALARPWDVIICDYNLPGFDAYAALELRREYAPHTPFIVLSGSMGEEAAVEVLKAGARDCLLKSNLRRVGPVVASALLDAETRRREREAQQALVESEARFRRLAENAPDIVFRYRMLPPRGFEYVSCGALRITGYAPEEFYDDPGLAAGMIHPDDRETFERSLRTSGPAVSLRFFHKDGSLRWAELHNVRVEDDAGDLVATEGIVRDVTDRVAADRAIAASEERLRLALEAGRMLIYDWDLRTGETIISGFGWGAPGLTPDELYDLESFLAVVHPDDSDAFRAGLETDLESGGQSELEFRVVGSDGSIRWVADRSTVFTEGDVPVRNVGIAADITSRKEAELALRKTTTLLQTILDSSPLGIVTIDADDRVTVWNKAAERLLGWRSEEVIGSPLPILPPDDLEGVRIMHERLREEGGTLALETKRFRKDGALIDVRVWLAALSSDVDTRPGILGTVEDIRDRKRAEREARENFELLRKGDQERRALLERLVRAQEEERQRIAGDIHDDSVQVMTALVIRLDSLRRQIHEPALLAILDDVEKTARGSITRLRNLMFELRPPALDRDGLAAALRLYLDNVAPERGLLYDLDDRLEREPEPTARAILYRIAQEALTNVMKHARATCVSVVVESRDGGAAIRIEDDGRGFDPEDGRARARHIGLTSMRERAELSGGWWRIDSARGEGTRVEFFVPDSEQRTETA